MALFPENRLSLFGAPNTKDCLASISKALIDARSNHNLTNDALAAGLGCSTTTIKNAISESNLLRADVLCRFGYFFPEEYAPIAALQKAAVPEKLTLQDRVSRVEAHLDAICRESNTDGPGLRAVKARVAR